MPPLAVQPLVFSPKLGQKIRGSFYRGSLWWGVVSLWNMSEKGDRGGEAGGWGGDRQRNRQVNEHAFVKTTLKQTTVAAVEIAVRKNIVLAAFAD